jgi:CheY-specific phosphatase CheX
MELREAFIKAVLEVYALYTIQGEFKQIAEENMLATHDVNVMISFAPNPKGKVICGFSRKGALQIAAAMLGREVLSLDTAAYNAMGEFITFITSLAIGKTAVIGSMYFSVPVIVTGTNVYLMISRQKSSQLVFQMPDDEMLLAYCIE